MILGEKYLYLFYAMIISVIKIVDINSLNIIIIFLNRSYKTIEMIKISFESII